VLDNLSNDGSDEIAPRAAAQADVLNHLFVISRSPYTLLIREDVVMLSPSWLDVCLWQFREDVAPVSPEDVGCGPLTRFWGAGRPESSFLMFDTGRAREARLWFWRQRFRIRWPHRALDFTGDISPTICRRCWSGAAGGSRS
jgi:hypothetical protein